MLEIMVFENWEGVKDVNQGREETTLESCEDATRWSGSNRLAVGEFALGELGNPSLERNKGNHELNNGSGNTRSFCFG